MSTFAPTAFPQLARYDPTKHVNYSIGMVLGVDDFNQEFTYLDARDRRIVRDLLGSGVISGLRVSIDVDARRGPRVVVAPGEAVTPSGRFVAVVPSQCAYLNEWLAANRPQVEGIASPPEASVRLAVVASWQQAQTDQVPIPGEPCRSDSELMAPSRLQDSFSLDLRSTPPVALGDQVIRELVAWARQIPVLDGPDPGLDAFLDRVREAAGLAASPPGELDFLRTPPPPGISIPRGSERQYLDAFLRLWATELRPALGSPARGGEADPGGGSGPLDADADSLVLAELTVPVVHDAVSGAIRVADDTAVTVEEETRATLLPMRLLQELALGAPAPGAPAAASGHVLADGSVRGGGGSLSAKLLSPTVFLLSFQGFDPTAEQVVLGHPVSRLGDAAPSTFEVISSSDPGLAPLLGSPPAHGVAVRVKRADGSAVADGFMVRIEQSGARP